MDIAISTHTPNCKCTIHSRPKHFIHTTNNLSGEWTQKILRQSETICNSPLHALNHVCVQADLTNHDHHHLVNVCVCVYMSPCVHLMPLWVAKAGARVAIYAMCGHAS